MKLQPKYRRIMTISAFFGSITGGAIWFLTMKLIFDYFGFDLDKGDAQFSHPYLFGSAAFVLFALYIFIMTFVCLLPVVATKTITIKEAFRGVFLYKHPKRWLK